MKKTRLLALLLALATVLGLLVSCGGNPATPPENETTTAEPAATEAPVQDVVIADKDLSDYSIVRPENLDSKSDTVVNAIAIKNTINEKFGSNLAIKGDWYNDKKDTLPEKAKEILIGKTNRKETTDALAKIHAMDFIIKYENERLVITGGCEESTVKAVKYFTENFIDKQTGKLVIKDNLEYIERYDYIYSSIAIDGVDISKYTIVYAETADKYPMYTAQNLSDLILGCVGVELPVISSKKAENEYEILIGETTRDASVEAAKKTLADDEFLLCKEGTKIVMLGKDYTVAGAAGKLMNGYLAPNGKKYAADAKGIPSVADAKPEKQVFADEAKNVILMIGDGMGRNQVLAAINKNKIPVWEGDKFPGQAYCVTASRSVQLGKKTYTDSAAAATALATGYKTINGYLGLNENQKKVKNICELSTSVGALNGLITTDKIEGATPAGFYAHINDRDASEDILKQLDKEKAAGTIQFAEGSLGESLLKNTREDLKIISVNGSRFFTMIEEAYPDKGGHNGDLDKTVTGVVRLNECVKYAACFTMMHPDTALLVTADHETGGLTDTFTYTGTNHTNADVPVYGIGAGVVEFLKSGKIDNTDISRFTAKAYGADKWGQ